MPLSQKILEISASTFTKKERRHRVGFNFAQWNVDSQLTGEERNDRSTIAKEFQYESDDHYLQDKYPKDLHARQSDHVVPPGLRVHIQLLRAIKDYITFTRII